MFSPSSDTNNGIFKLESLNLCSHQTERLIKENKHIPSVWEFMDLLNFFKSFSRRSSQSISPRIKYSWKRKKYKCERNFIAKIDNTH